MSIERTRLLEAAARAYGELGFRGATTRRIADEAGVNEITIFRQFGSKEALISEALRTETSRSRLPQLPEVPRDPASELTDWCVDVLSRMTAARSLILRMMGELVERPDVAPCAAEGRLNAMRELLDYVERLREQGLCDEKAGSQDGGPTLSPVDGRAASPAEPEDGDSVVTSAAEIDRYAAVSMLISALFSDAMGRQIMPGAYPKPVSRAPAAYVRVFLGALGVRAPRPDHTLPSAPEPV